MVSSFQAAGSSAKLVSRGDAEVMPPPSIQSTNQKRRIKTATHAAENASHTLNSSDAENQRNGVTMNATKDMNVAMELDDSFTSSMASQALAMAVENSSQAEAKLSGEAGKPRATNFRDSETVTSKTRSPVGFDTKRPTLIGRLKEPSWKGRTRCAGTGLSCAKPGQDLTELGDSLTYSMIAKVLDSEADKSHRREAKKSQAADLGSKCSGMSRSHSANSKNSETSNSDFSHDTASIVREICGDTPGRKTKPAPKRKGKENVRKRKGVQASGQEGGASPPKRSRRTPQRKDCSESRNNSAASDYVPPTPPDPEITASARTPRKPKKCDEAKSSAAPEQSSKSAKKTSRPPGLQKSDREKLISAKKPTLQKAMSATCDTVSERIYQRTNSAPDSGRSTKIVPSEISASGNSQENGKFKEVDESRSEQCPKPVHSETGNSSQNASVSVPLTFQAFTITDVAANKLLFEHFVEEWRTQKEYTLCLACEKVPAQVKEVGRIGSNFNKGKEPLDS